MQAKFYLINENLRRVILFEIYSENWCIYLGSTDDQNEPEFNFKKTKLFSETKMFSVIKVLGVTKVTISFGINLNVRKLIEQTFCRKVFEFKIRQSSDDF